MGETATVRDVMAMGRMLAVGVVRWATFDGDCPALQLTGGGRCCPPTLDDAIGLMLAVGGVSWVTLSMLVEALALWMAC